MICWRAHGASSAVCVQTESSLFRYGFVEYENAELAARAVKELNNHQLDKVHKILCNPFSDFERFASITDKFDEPKVLDVPAVENFRDWLEDARAVDQYVIRFAEKTEVYWNEQKGAQKAELAYTRDNWTDSFVQWYACSAADLA
jgi:translation initiation factor 3 subunit B